MIDESATAAAISSNQKGAGLHGNEWLKDWAEESGNKEKMQKNVGTAANLVWLCSTCFI